MFCCIGNTYFNLTGGFMKNSDKPARPLPIASSSEGIITDCGDYEPDNIGMTKRESFIQTNLQGLLANPIHSDQSDEWLYNYAKNLADYSLKELDNGS